MPELGYHIIGENQVGRPNSVYFGSSFIVPVNAKITEIYAYTGMFSTSGDITVFLQSKNGSDQPDTMLYKEEFIGVVGPTDNWCGGVLSTPQFVAGGTRIFFGFWCSETARQYYDNYVDGSNNKDYERGSEVYNTLQSPDSNTGNYTINFGSWSIYVKYQPTDGNVAWTTA